MPELPEVETVRRGLERHAVGRRITQVRVAGPRAVRRQPGGADELTARLRSRLVTGTGRRGKYLWLTTDDPEGWCLHVHLGMSGQMLIQEAGEALPRHTHVVASLDDGRELRFVDQRTFGGWTVVPMAAGRGGREVPAPVAHVAPDPFEESFDAVAVARRIRARDTEIKRQLLDQTLVAGIGNIYADEGLWRAGIHGRRRGGALTRRAVEDLLGHCRDVMAESMERGGTSFDGLYVDVNGASGGHDTSLAAYGRRGRPCPRCGTPIVREAFMNRSSHYCPHCQRAPRRPPALR